MIVPTFPDSFDTHYYLTIISISLMISVPLRMLEAKCNFSLPTHFLMMIISGSFGVLVAHCKYLDENLQTITSLPPRVLLSICLPPYVMASIYKLDYYIFMRNFPQALFVSVVGMTLNSIILGFILKDFLHKSWQLTSGVLAALTLIPIQPYNVVGVLKELSKVKYLGTILEAESVLLLVPVFISLEICIGAKDGSLIKWYQFVCVALRLTFGGFVFGAIMGKIVAVFIALLYHEPVGAVCLSISFAYMCNFIAQYLLGVSGVFSVVVYVWVLSTDRYKFSQEVDNTICQFWVAFSYIIDLSIQVICTTEMLRFICKHFILRCLYASAITYFVINIVRITVYLLLGLIIRRITYTIDLGCLMVLGWSGVKGSHCFLINLILLTHRSTNIIAQEIVVEVLVTVLLSQLINNSTIRIALRLVGLSEISNSRKTNMNSCMKFIMEKRKMILDILKLSKYMMDAEWNVVRSETIIQHPYKQTKSKEDDKNEDDDDDDDIYLNSTSGVVCPDCQKEVPFDISEKEFLEMMNEAESKILKAKKVSAIKQYENGIIDKNCVQVLVYTYEVMIESTVKQQRIDLKYYLKSGKCWDRIRRFMLKIANDVDIEPPTKQCRRLCYFSVMHIAYDYIFYLIIMLYATCVLLDVFKKITFGVYGHLGFFFVFLFDFIVKLIGLSGFKQYFRFFWYWFDFTLLMVSLCGFFVVWCGRKKNIERIGRKILEYSTYVRLLRGLYLLNPIIPLIIRAIENKIDRKICFGYELATALINCSDEVLEIIDQLIDFRVIRNSYKQQILEERNILHKEIEKIQRKRPWIAITVKTKQAIRTTIVSMEDALKQLKTSGFVDNVEYACINKTIFEKQKILRNLKFVQPSPPKVIFNEVPWMDEKIIEYLYNNVSTVSWDAGEVVCREGTFSKGIYIIVTGSLRISYTPKLSILENLEKRGHIPVIDYLSTLMFKNHFTDTIMSGSSFGELSVLTGRPYDCSIVADSPSRAYLISPELIKEAMKYHNDPITGLEARMWKCVTINLAVAALMDAPLYQSYNLEQIKFKVEKAFVPNLRCYKLFVVTEAMDDIILIEGVAADFNTGEFFAAPKVIPRTVQKLILPASSYMNMFEGAETRLLIIPMGDAKIYDIMENEEEVAELTSVVSSHCLLHAIQEQSRKKYKKNLQKLQTDPRIFSKTSSASFYNNPYNRKSTEIIEVLGSNQTLPTSSTDENERDSTRSDNKRKYLLQNKKIDSKDNHLV